MNYYVQRTLQAVVTIWGVITLTFVLINFMPAGPMDYLRAQLVQQNPGASTEQIDQIAEVYLQVNPSEPLHIKYIDYMHSIFTGDLGKSLIFSESVSSLIAHTLPWTLFIMVISSILTFAIAIVLGAIMGYAEGSRFDKVTTILTITFNSVPYYIMGLLFLLMFGYRLGWFPTGGAYRTQEVNPGLNATFMLDILHHATLPILSFTITGVGIYALLMRGNSISIIGEDYMRVGKLRGLSDRKLAIGYVAKNAVLPLYTNFLLFISATLGGSVILERIFRYPGIGDKLLRAVQARDVPLIMGGLIVIATAVVLGMYFADLTYGKLDPRVGSEN